MQGFCPPSMSLAAAARTRTLQRISLRIMMTYLLDTVSDFIKGEAKHCYREAQDTNGHSPKLVEDPSHTLIEEEPACLDRIVCHLFPFFGRCLLIRIGMVELP